MSPNGTLMAYTTPTDIRALRDQAALLSMAWKDHSTKHPSPLTTLTIETPHNNIIARAIQPSLLLVLVGTVPPNRKPDVFKITPEAQADARYPREVGEEEEGTQVVGSGKAPSVMSTVSVRERDLKGGVLHVQRRKVDALVGYLRRDFEEKGFVMPDDSSFS